MPENKYLAKDGWVRITATIGRYKALSEEEIKTLLSFGKDPNLSEWGPVQQAGKRIKAIIRTRSTTAPTY